jgi:hypothetical protein
MDKAEFDGWLSGIAALTPPQRRQTWQMLGLSEASDGDDIETGPPPGVDIASSGAAAPPVPPADLHAPACDAAVEPAWKRCCCRTWATPAGQHRLPALR